MRMSLRFLALAAFGVIGLAAPAQSQIIIGGPLVPTRAVYVPTTTTVMNQNVITGSPIGPTAYVAQPATVMVQPRTYVTTTRMYVPRRAYVPTTTYVPATTYVPTTTFVPRTRYVVDPAVTPVGYEVVRPGRTKLVYPRQVVRYVY